MATKNVTIKVKEDDPTGYTYVGLYSDSGYSTLLTESKTYSFNVSSGSTTDLFIKYKKSPFTLSFNSNSDMGYTVSLSYNGTPYTIKVPITGGKEMSFELLENTTNTLTITSIESDTIGQEVSEIKVDNTAITLPFTKSVNNWKGQTIGITVDNIQTTTTTTSTTTLPSTTLHFKRVPAQDGTRNYMPYNVTYSVQGAVDSSTKTVDVKSSDVAIPITYEPGSALTLTISSLLSTSAAGSYDWHSNKILYKKVGDTSYQTLNIPNANISVDTSVGNEVTPVIYWDGPTTNVIFEAVKDITNTQYVNYTAQYIDSNFETKSVTVNNQDVTVAALTPLSTSATWILNSISTDADIEYKKYSYAGTTTLSNSLGNTRTITTAEDIISEIEEGYVNIKPTFDYIETTTTSTSTAAPAVVNLQSNVASTVYVSVPDQEDKTVTLAANTKTGVNIDMN